ncbi:hypothetical protein HPB52_024697 [Rhipicephalus sanguineus]|uniref:Uncharacterized protein n=1 Tax=Rhipicephalus sanguineus TaxID=34632 RepID=A0A9D4TE29_RHISA|nr:hypothetical protein HPB52_024697 [Rhipicephalus sanguineus]
MKAYANEIAHAVKTLGAAQELDLQLSCSFIPDLFKGLDKKRARDKYAKEAFPFVAPEELVLGQGAKYHYVPLPKLLHVLCSIPDIVAHLKTPGPKYQAPSVYRDYADEFAERYGPSAVAPKLHYMVPYGRFVREVGPLNDFWAMRFEAKHQYFKKMAACVKNFKNLTFTLAKRHQLKQSFELHGFQL